MKQISSLELHFLLNELDVLKNSRVDNIYNLGKEVLTFQFHKSNEGKLMLKVLVGKSIFLSENKEAGESPSNFCQFLRKRLEGKFLIDITQIEPERIIKLIFKSKEDTINVFIEFFGSGNVILCSEDGHILNALTLHKFKDRSILHKEKYIYPKSSFNFLNIKDSELPVLLKNSKKDRIVTSLAIELGLGGVYSEEVCIKSGIDKNTAPKNITPQYSKQLHSSLKKLLSSHPDPSAVFSGAEIIDSVPFNLEFYSRFQSTKFKSFSNSLEFYYDSCKQKTKSGVERKAEGILKIIEHQESAISELIKEEKELRLKAEAIYNNYSLIKEIIGELKKASTTLSWKEIKSKLAGHKIIKKIDEKDKVAVMEINQLSN